MRPRVFITNRGFHSYDDAERYGDLIAVTVGNVDLKHTDRLEAKIQAVLQDSRPTDILLLSGAPIIQFYCIGYWVRKHGQVNVLYYDAGPREYVLRRDQAFEEIEDVSSLMGFIRCPTCNRVIAEAPMGISAIAEHECDVCAAKKENNVSRT